MNFGVFSENGSSKKAKSPRRYPKRAVARKDYTEGNVPNDDDYICKYISLLLLVLFLEFLDTVEPC